MIFSKKNITQFISYFFVGGCAALVEWGCFYLFAVVWHLQYLLATGLAFIFSTTANLILGKLIPFRQSERFKDNKVGEAVAVFAVSAIGLVLNMALMFLFVQVLGFDTGLQMTASKICATGIVFIWNFLIRKLVIYKV